MHGSLALKLRVLRAERALTIEQAAERASVTPETISDAERGRRHPYLPTLRKLAKAYEVPVEELLAEEPAQEPEPAGHGPKGEAPQEPGRTRTYSEVAKELEEVREGFRPERESFEENISRWERWLRVGGFSDAHLDEFLRNATSYHLALRGLARDELTTITGVLELELEEGDTFPDEAVRQSSLLPVADRFAALAYGLREVWGELQRVEDKAEGEAVDVPVHMEELRARASLREAAGSNLAPRGSQEAG